MPLLCYYVAFSLLCSVAFLSPVSPPQCNETQYSWPVDAAKFCCDKCPKGKHMKRRHADSCTIECEPCAGERYIEQDNVDMYCKLCRNCNKTHMEYQSRCKTTSNAVCRCSAGFKCKDPDCSQCVPVPATKPTPTASPKPFKPPKPIGETVWFLVIVALLCFGIALVIATKIKPFLRWIKAMDSCFLLKKPTLRPSCSEDDDYVCMPVQEESRRTSCSIDA